jgi:hypothetical protein
MSFFSYLPFGIKAQYYKTFLVLFTIGKSVYCRKHFSHNLMLSSTPQCLTYSDSTLNLIKRLVGLFLRTNLSSNEVFSTFLPFGIKAKKYKTFFFDLGR